MAETQTQVVSLDLGARSYDIHIGAGLLARAGTLIAPLLIRPEVAIVTDDNVAKLHLDALRAALASSGVASTPIVVPAGEASKSYGQLAELCDALLQAGVERRDHVIVLGGGVIGDLAGFAACIVRRGVEFIQVPTSLLAQVDSSVGGKTGINSPAGKNLIGAFHQPRAVIADTALLDTLPTRQLAAGYAEVVKYGLLGDQDFFAWLETHGRDVLAGDPRARAYAVGESCRAKARIVAQDEREAGTRALLNLGHTFGHALEAATRYTERLLHGEGVAIGAVLALRYSQRLALCPPGTADRAAAHLGAAGLPTSLSQIPGDLPDAGDLVAFMHQDKKSEAGKLVLILAKAIGNAFVARDIDEEDLVEFLATQLVRS